MLLIFDNIKILLTGIYGPNQDNPNLYKNKAFTLIDQWEPDFTIYGGDWNLDMNQHLDTKNYLHENNMHSKTEILKKMEYYSLIDVWRELNPSSSKFTWIGKITNPKKYARLDFFLISNSLFLL